MQAPGQDQEDQKDQGEDQEEDQENQDKKLMVATWNVDTLKPEDICTSSELPDAVKEHSYDEL